MLRNDHEQRILTVFSMQPIPLSIRGTGSYLPTRIVTSDDIDQRLGWAAGTCLGTYGIVQRHIADRDETTSAMAAEAALRAMEMAGLAPRDLDLIIGACGVTEQAVPSTAVLVQRRLGLERCGTPAWDVNATCLGFIQGLGVAALHIQAGLAQRVLVFSSDIASVGLDWNDPDTAVIFGDGAGAVVVEAGEGALLSSGFETWSEAHDACVLEAGGTRVNAERGILAGQDRLQMDGQRVHRVASRQLPRFLRRLLIRSGIGLDRLDCVIPHQASAATIQHAIHNLLLGAERVINIFPHTGNQIAASIPTALDHAVRGGRLKHGDHALLIGTSAGVSLGGAVLRF